MRYRGEAYRAHDPRWSFTPLSGAGAATHGGRFNARGSQALYLALGVMTAIKEANQGLAHKIAPCVLCTYLVDCDDIADLRTPDERAALGVDEGDLSCPWFLQAKRGETPPSWWVATALQAQGFAGILVPSYAPGAEAADSNLVLWNWSEQRPHQVRVHDPDGRLPKNQMSWS